jgi:hypothetical protein
MAVKDQRIRIYVLEDVGEDGAINQMYVRRASAKDDQGYWGGVNPDSMRETTVGAQGAHKVLYGVVMDDTVPLVNGDDAVIAVLGADDEEIQWMKVEAVMLLRPTREKKARCTEDSDENWADRLTA